MQDNIESVVEQIKKEENFITKARLLRFLVVDKDIRIKDLSQMTGIKESYICHILRLNKLTDMIIDGYYSKMISITHLFIISRLHTEKDIMAAYEKVLTENLTVSQTEELIREILYNTKTVGERISVEEKETAKKEVAKLFNAELKLTQTRVRSKLIIEIKGSHAITTPIIRTILKKLMAFDQQVT